MPAAAAKKILLVDDDDNLRRTLAEQLALDGEFEAEEAATATEGLQKAKAGRFDVILLDVGLPDGDGRELCREMRRAQIAAPIIMLTGVDGEADTIRGLDSGANDYVTKPFGVQELMARIRVLLRWHAAAGEASPVFDDGRLHVDLARREVRLAGEPLALSRKEYALLAFLVQHAGRVVTQPQLLRELWGPTHQEDTHYLRILVGKLRQKLGDDAAAPRWIATEPGVGLRFLSSGQGL